MSRKREYYEVTHHLRDGSTFQYDLPKGYFVELARAVAHPNVAKVTIELVKCSVGDWESRFRHYDW